MMKVGLIYIMLQGSWLSKVLDAVNDLGVAC